MNEPSPEYTARVAEARRRQAEQDQRASVDAMAARIKADREAAEAQAFADAQQIAAAHAQDRERVTPTARSTDTLSASIDASFFMQGRQKEWTDQ